MVMSRVLKDQEDGVITEGFREEAMLKPGNEDSAGICRVNKENLHQKAIVVCPRRDYQLLLCAPRARGANAFILPLKIL